MSIVIHRASGASSNHSARARCTAAMAMALLSAPTWAAPLGLADPWPPAHQLMLVTYVIVAAALAGVLLGMLRRSMRRSNRRSSSPRRSGQSARRPQGLGVAGAGWQTHRSTANARSDFGADSGLPTEPAAWGYKLDDFTNLPPSDDGEAEHVAQVVDHVVDQAVDQALDAGTAATRQPVQRPRIRRSKPLRRPSGPALGPTTA